MPETPRSLADHLREEAGRVVDLFKHLSRDQWEILIYPQESDWSFHHLLAHFVSAEICHKELVANICAGGRGFPPGFDIDRFNQSEVERLSAQPNDSLLHRFTQERTNLIELISMISPQDLERVGNDHYLGGEPFLDIIKLTYRHLQIHLRDARQ